MKLSWYPITLDLKTTFRIAHGASDQRHSVVVSMEFGECIGWGEAAVVAYHGETQSGVMDYLANLAGTRADPALIDNPYMIEEYLTKLPDGSRAARAALDVAFHDVWGQSIGQPLYRLFGLNPNSVPMTSFTIAMDEPSIMAERASQSGLPIIKIKLGSEEDEAIVAAIRSTSNARLRLDANAGWSREQAARLIPRLARYNIEFIEQPLAIGDIEGLRWLRTQKLGVPIFADESIKSSKDVAKHADAVDGVVIKLMKTGGLREAQRAIHTARALGMQVMIGCMVETSLGVTAAAHIAPMCDYVDLDGPLLIKADPFDGVHYKGAQLILPDNPGLGVKLVEN